MPRIKITQEKSSIRTLLKHRRTLEALGLKRINHFVVHEDTPQIRGMVDQVRYLVRVEPAAGVEATPKAKARRTKS
jgi:large subunit ribosomal protein L30